MNKIKNILLVDADDYVDVFVDGEFVDTFFSVYYDKISRALIKLVRLLNKDVDIIETDVSNFYIDVDDEYQFNDDYTDFTNWGSFTNQELEYIKEGKFAECNKLMVERFKNGGNR